MIESFPRLPVEIELVAYRVVQEALFNVARHSGSETAEVKIVHTAVGSAWKVDLSITDFGVGMQKKPRRATGASRGAGIGLDSMRERVHQIGGVLQIQSLPGKTTISAVLPVRKGE
jgi:signal transduction histidine kinase